MARSTLGRADLLRLLVRATPVQLELVSDAQHWFGFELEERQLAPAVTVSASAAGVETTQASVPSFLPPLQMSHIPAVVERTERMFGAELDEPTEEEIANTPLERDASLVPRSPPEPEPLVPHARLLPALRRALGGVRAGGLDFERLADRLAQRRLTRVLPRKVVPRWHPQLVVIADLSLRLWPYGLDMWRLASALGEVCASTEVSTWFTRATPGSGIVHWSVQEHASHERRAWCLPAPGSRVLILSDLGLLLGPQTETAQRWQHFIEQLLAAKVQPMALVPLGAEQVDAGAARLLPIYRWSPDSNLRRARGQVPAERLTGLDSLLGLVGCARRVDPALLRGLRKLNWPAPSNAGLEGAVWCHPQVKAQLLAALEPAAVARYREPLQEPAWEATLAQVDELCREHHAHLDLALEREEDLLRLAYRGRRPDDMQVRSYLLRLCQELARPQDPDSAARWRSVAAGILDRCDAAIRRRFFKELAQLSAVLADGHANTQRSVPGWVVYEVSTGELRVQATLPRGRQQVLAEGLQLGAPAVHTGLQGTARWSAPGELPITLELAHSMSVEIDTGLQRLQLASLPRPRGIVHWAVRSGALHLEGPPLCGERFERAYPLTDLPVRPSEAGWALYIEAGEAVPGRPVFGLDVFGLYADLLIKGRHGSATQRLRWMEPGVFLMGSPADEADRRGNEGPQHSVRVSLGFWLADTACTQGLWQAVMGRNPSDFKRNDQLPVENVSWNDACKFLQALQELLPGSQWGLPSEAQWEYACRAGTPTPFSFGANITPQQVNYHGGYPYAGAAKGEFRAQTVAVKSLPANPWGLYEMHGNVLEWCADGLREYTADAVTDPVGFLQDGPAPRAVRGGSWNYDARYARSAYRYRIVPGYRFDLLGFRLCSRSGPVALRGAQSDSSRGPRSEARPARDAPGAVRRWIKRLRPKR